MKKEVIEVVINFLRLYVYGYDTNIGILEVEVHRSSSVYSLSNYCLKLLYAMEITKFPYQMNSHEIFNHGHF